MASGEAAALLGGDPAAFYSILYSLESSSNTERTAAAAAFRRLRVSQPEALALRLSSSVADPAAPADLCAVLLRSLLAPAPSSSNSAAPLWPQLSPAGQAALKSDLLTALESDQPKFIARKICNVVSELAASLLPENAWEELLPFLISVASRSQQPNFQESALLIFARLADYIAGSPLDRFHKLLTSVLKHSTCPDVRIAALSVVVNLVQCAPTNMERDKMQDLVPVMMGSITGCLDAGQETYAQEALELLVELAGAEPKFLRRQIADVVEGMLRVAEATEWEDRTRHLAVEFVITLAEARERARGMMRQLPQFVGRLFAVLMQMLLDVEDDPAWHSAENEDADAGEGNSYGVAQEGLDRLAIAIGGNVIMPIASELLPQYLSAPEWQKHHAALITLARIAEGCAKVMLKSLERVILMICSEFQHPHSRVRWAAVNALCQLCADLGPVLQIHYHEVVLAELVNAMDDFQNPRVQAHAASAVLNFSENSTPEVMKHYIGALISKLLALLKTGKQVLQEGAVKALGALADSSQGHFKEYYDAVMPHLKAILMNATDKSNRLLRAKSMECISLVGMAVGKDKFRDDAEQVVEILVALQGTPMGNDDPITSYMLEAWARLCKCLGQDFLPYMHFIMPPLLTSARLKPDVTVSDDDSIGTATLGDIGIRTSVLEEKATACNMLCCYADELKEGFVPWIDEVIDVLVPLLKFYIHEEVRRAAIAAMPGLLRSAELAVAKGQYHECDVKMLFDNIISALVEALGKESETEICSSILDSLNECLEISSHPLDEHQARAISERIEAVIIASRTRIKNNLDRSEAEDFDVDEKELFNEENEQEEVLDRVAKCLRILIRKSKASFLQLFDKLSVHITPMLGKGTTIEERRAAICIFNDVADHCGERALKYYETFLPSILEGINDDNPNIREAAVHGVGVCAKFGRLAFHPIVHEALIKLRTLLKRLELQYPHNRMAYDNAASALEKIVQFHWDSCYKIAEKKGKQHRAEWSDYDSRVFCTICLEEIQAKRMVPGKLPEEEDILDGIRQKLFSRTARLYVKNQLKIKFKNLIQSYRRLDHKKEHKNLELYIQIFDECPDEEKVISAECSDVGSTDGDTISRHQFKQNPPLANQEDAIRANEVLLLRKEIECLKLELMQVRDANDRSDIELQEQKNLREQLLLYDEKNNELQEQNKNLKQQLEEALTGQKVAMSLYEEQKEKVCHLDAELVKAEKLRSQMHNLIMELKGQIRVFCRVRPLFAAGNSNGSSDLGASISYPESIEYAGRAIVVRQSGQRIFFTCDKVFDDQAPQREIFGEISELVQSALDGYKVCIFAYGQTGSGKTYTMMGEVEDDAKGIIPRSLEKIFETTESRRSKGWEYSVKISMLEVYNEAIRDLTTEKLCKVRHDELGNVVVSGLEGYVVNQASEALSLLEQASKRRSVAKTLMNERSSRSHFVFQLMISRSNKTASEKVEGALNLIDLAGSERAAKSGVTGDQLKETNAINTSLLYLGNVIAAIENGAAHVPFRDSTLTFLLEDCLGRDSKTLMFINISPETASLEETSRTFDFASRVNACNKKVISGTESDEAESEDCSFASIKRMQQMKSKNLLKLRPEGLKSPGQRRDGHGTCASSMRTLKRCRTTSKKLDVHHPRTQDILFSAGR